VALSIVVQCCDALQRYDGEPVVPYCLVHLIEPPESQARTFLEAESEGLVAFLRAHLDIPVRDFVGFREEVPDSTILDRVAIERVHVAPFGGAVAAGDRVILTVAARVRIIMHNDATSTLPRQPAREATFMVDVEATAIRTETGYADLLWIAARRQKLTLAERIGNFLESPD
jgi:hypothetical protein